MHTECIARFNDHQMTVDPVLAAFDRAIAGGGSHDRRDRAG
jgi:hypothetical protein